MPFAIPLPDPNESDGTAQRHSRWLRFRSIISVVLSAVIYLWIYIAGLQFEDIFGGFGQDLPGLTRTVLGSYKLNGLLLLIGLVPCVILVTEPDTSARKRTRLVKFVTLGFGLAWTSLTVFTVAMYLPVFAMSAAVQ